MTDFQVLRSVLGFAIRLCGLFEITRPSIPFVYNHWQCHRAHALPCDSLIFRKSSPKVTFCLNLLSSSTASFPVPITTTLHPPLLRHFTRTISYKDLLDNDCRPSRQCILKQSECRTSYQDYVTIVVVLLPTEGQPLQPV